MNLYANLDELKRALRIAASTTTHDAYLLELSAGASRAVDDYCKRHFYTRSAVKYLPAVNCRRVVMDDVLSVTAVGADSEGDGSFDGEAWVEDTDYTLRPRDGFPKWLMVPHKNTDKSLGYDDDEYLKVTAVWGYGDGQSASPWKSLGVTVTVADASATSVTASASGSINPGDTLRAGTEQMYVESTSGTTLTVLRGVNGTTAAAQSAATAYRAQYPAPVTRFVVALASEAFGKRTAAGVRQEMLGTHQIVYQDIDEKIYQRALGAYRKPVIG